MGSDPQMPQQQMMLRQEMRKGDGHDVSDGEGVGGWSGQS